MLAVFAVLVLDDIVRLLVVGNALFDRIELKRVFHAVGGVGQVT